MRLGRGFFSYEAGVSEARFILKCGILHEHGTSEFVPEYADIRKKKAGSSERTVHLKNRGTEAQKEGPGQKEGGGGRPRIKRSAPRDGWSQAPLPTPFGQD